MKRYSQGIEQDVILSYFGNKRGTFLDLGANDGITFSNTHHLAQMGWSGVCVEPAQTAFAALSKLYRGNDKIECVNAAICSAPGIVPFHESGSHLGKGDTALLSTTKASEMDRWKSSGETFTETEAECITFDGLLERTDHRRFDLISIDVEGADLEALIQIDLKEVGCKMLIVEVNDRDPFAYVEYCKAHKMKPHRMRTPENLIFIR